MIPTEQVFQEAVALHQAGELEAAGNLYLSILQTYPHHAETNHNMGSLAVQMNQAAAGLPYFSAALEFDPTRQHYWLSYIDALFQAGQPDEARNIFTLARLQGLQGDEVDQLAAYLDAGALPDPLPLVNADAHFDSGNTLKAQGQLEGAVASYRQALKLNPEFAEAYYNLGNTLTDLGRLDEAAENYRHTLRLVPDNAMVHSNLGAVYQESGRHSEAEFNFRRALNLEPNYADAHCNLGITLQKLERLKEAELCYRRALGIKPDFTNALTNLASLYHLQGKTMLALDMVKQSLHSNETVAAKRIFVACIKRMAFTHADPDLRIALVRALTEPWGRPGELARASIDIIKLNPVIAACITRANNAWPQRLPAHDLFGSDGLDTVAADPLLRAVLETTPLCDVAMERFLTQARYQLLDTATRITDAGHLEDAVLNFYCALTRQCFINEYVFAYTDDEMQKADALRDALSTALKENRPVPDVWPVAVAAYFPLHSIAHATLLLERPWPAAMNGVLDQQLREPAEELQLRSTIPRLTAIDNDISLQVQNQYEENPYPRWIKTAPAADAKPVDGYLSEKFPLAIFEHQGMRRRTEVLVAGCGTGQHPIATAQRLSGAQILAVDLSLSSLAYAQRKTREMGLTSIEFAQADLLNFGSLGKSFDVIESSGVLHHLADPWKGWRVLLSMLRPGGFMKLGFYSALARRDVVRIRNYIAERGYGSTSADIRQCRQALIELNKSENFGTTLNSPDFFSGSACRDLLFHVQEHRLTLDQIRTFLSENDLHFLGFEIEGGVLQAYQQRFPDDRAATDLGQWQIFETENPDTFGNMYQFWIQNTL